MTDIIQEHTRKTYMSALEDCVTLLQRRGLTESADVIKQFQIRMMQVWRKKDQANG